ncbi:oxytocin/vasopressin-like peptide isoform X3 [Leptinotarsa decemlineata]|uniref:oxytocin/vasopressin-like peptide isoform X3 n=1 Tax=Leptinotarsa decemlineata TaxID=7539 RepID=UPI003D309AE3
MSKTVSLSILFLAVSVIFVESCLITNCPIGGKRSGKFSLTESNIKPCISCGPGHTGKCFGPNICCGPFGCLLGSPETERCHKEGLFQETEPCIAGFSTCRKNTGRCAAEKICCTQDSCHRDTQCSKEERTRPLSENAVGMELYKLINNPSELFIEK